MDIMHICYIITFLFCIEELIHKIKKIKEKHVLRLDYKTNSTHRLIRNFVFCQVKEYQNNAFRKHI